MELFALLETKINFKHIYVKKISESRPYEMKKNQITMDVGASFFPVKIKIL